MNIIINQLQKNFGPKVAVDIENYSIQSGNMLGLVGNNGEKQEQQKTIINNKQRAVNKLCHSLTSAVHRSLFYLQFAIYHILFIIHSSPYATPIMIRLLQAV